VHRSDEMVGRSQIAGVVAKAADYRKLRGALAELVWKPYRFPAGEEADLGVTRTQIPAQIPSLSVRKLRITQALALDLTTWLAYATTVLTRVPALRQNPEQRIPNTRRSDLNRRRSEVTRDPCKAIDRSDEAIDRS